MDRHVIRSLLFKFCPLARETIEFHALSERVFALDLIDPSLGIHLEVITKVLFRNLTVRLIDSEVPVRIGTIISRGDAVAEEREPHVDARLLETFANQRLV